MATTHDLTADPTDDEIDAAILAALAPTGDELVSWPRIAQRVPGCFWSKATALHRLHNDGRVYLIKVRGRPYVCLGDDADAQLAIIARARGRSRKVIVA